VRRNFGAAGRRRPEISIQGAGGPVIGSQSMPLPIRLLQARDQAGGTAA
jgi:hypothetical protein